MYHSLFYDKEGDGEATAFESEPMCTGVTVRSKLDGRDLSSAGTIFSCAEPFASLSLSIRYLPIFFLVGQSSSAKIPLVALSSFFLPENRFITI